MENIIDTEYREISALEDRGTEVLTAEANALYQNAEVYAQMSMANLAEVGRRLNIIKEREGHGNWMEWCKANLSFSYRKAKNCMNLAEKIEEKSYLQTFANIEISKVWAVLNSPEEVQKEVIENPEILDGTVRELKEEIKNLKEEMQQRDQIAQSHLEDVRQQKNDAVAKAMELEKEVRVKEKELEGMSPEAVASLEEKLKASQEINQNMKMTHDREVDKLNKEKWRVEQELGRAKADLLKQPEKIIDEEAISRAVEEEKAKAESRVNTLEDEKKNLEARIARLKKEADKDMIVFAQMYKGLRHSFLEIIDYINSMDAEKQKKMTMALQKKLSELEDMAWQ